MVFLGPKNFFNSHELGHCATRNLGNGPNGGQSPKWANRVSLKFPHRVKRGKPHIGGGHISGKRGPQTGFFRKATPTPPILGDSAQKEGGVPKRRGTPTFL